MMGIAYLYMLLGLLSFACMGILHKLGDRLEGNPLALALLAMGTGSASSFVYGLSLHRNAFTAVPGNVVWIALPFGVAAALSLWFLQKALRYGNIATSWLIINLSAAIPTVLSMLLYHEALTAKKLAAFCLLVAALVLLWWDRRGHIGAAI